jgi:hypothetical protein
MNTFDFYGAVRIVRGSRINMAIQLDKRMVMIKFSRTDENITILPDR